MVRDLAMRERARRVALLGGLSSVMLPGYRLAGLGHSFARNLNLEMFKDRRLLFEGPYSGRFAAIRGLILPELFEARRSVLLQHSRA